MQALNLLHKTADVFVGVSLNMVEQALYYLSSDMAFGVNPNET